MRRRGMLVLSRKIEEQIVIDDVITVKVVSLSGGRVKLGIEAPRDVSVRRAEICSDNENTAPSVSPL
jgi:carbon storage regulator